METQFPVLYQQYNTAAPKTNPISETCMSIGFYMKIVIIYMDSVPGW